jgi:hypothetical protein
MTYPTSISRARFSYPGLDAEQIRHAVVQTGSFMIDSYGARSQVSFEPRADVN